MLPQSLQILILTEEMAMSNDCHYLHSHSGIEKKLMFPKNIVLVDNKYKDLFVSCKTSKMMYNGIEYLKVPILSFVYKGGVFKPFDK